MCLRNFDRRTYIADTARAFTQHRIGKREFLRRMALAGVSGEVRLLQSVLGELADSALGNVEFRQSARYPCFGRQSVDSLGRFGGGGVDVETSHVLAQGLGEGFCFSDAFVPSAPRPGA